MKGLSLLLLILFTSITYSQVLDYENKAEVTLNDGTEVTCYGELNYSRTFSNVYYYLPTNLRVSKKKDGSETPEFLFMKYTTDEGDENLKGALIHFLMEWGLTEPQKIEAAQKLKARLKTLAATNVKYGLVTNPILKAAVDVEKDGLNSMRIISSTLNGKSGVIASGEAPLLPGSKLAVSSKIENTDAMLLASTFEKSRSVTDVTLQLFFKYLVSFPAVRATVTIDWGQLNSIRERFKANGKMIPDEPHHSGFFGWGAHGDEDTKDELYSDDVVHHLYQEAINSKAINIVFFDNLQNEFTKEVQDLVFNKFTASIAEPDHSEDFVPAFNMSKTEDLRKSYANAEKWSMKMDKWQINVAKGKDSFKVDFNLAVPRSGTITTNLSDCYDAVKNNKKCINTVILNDPFYQTRNIDFVVDKESVPLFKQDVNYVTLDVRKRRSFGNPFEKSLTIKGTNLIENGLLVSTSYARGEDKDPSMFEYKVQWSLKGGKIFPSNPEWIMGDWAANTLIAPVYAKPIEFEANLEKMKALGFARATLQIRSKKFGEEVETNFPISVAVGRPLIEGVVLLDSIMKGYAYRIILTHETAGKIILDDWKPSLNDDNFYLSLSDDLKDQNSKLFKDALQRGKNITATDGVVDPLKRILEKFKDILETIKK